MRVLISPASDRSHLNPVLPMAWALQGAGHEVRVAAHPDLAQDITEAGLVGVSLDGADELPPMTSVSDHIIGDDERERLTAALGLAPGESHPWEFFAYYLIASMRIFCPPGADPARPQPLVDDLVGFARHWRPDVVIWDPIWLPGAVAARACGAASVRFMWGPDYVGWTCERFEARRPFLPGGVENPMEACMRPLASRHGVEMDQALLLGDATVDPIPHEVRVDTGQRVIDVRQLPSTGAGIVPEWLRTEPEKPRIAFTLGASQRKYQGDDADMIGVMLEAFAGMDDVEVVATLNADQLAGQRVPPNVRTFDYIPLGRLLSTCSALIHHGGGGSYAAATATEVPQVVLEVDPEAWAYGRKVTEPGAGLYLRPKEMSAEEVRAQLRRVLDEPSFAKGAAALADDWRSIPSPNDVTRVLEELAKSRPGSGTERSTR